MSKSAAVNNALKDTVLDDYYDKATIIGEIATDSSYYAYGGSADAITLTSLSTPLTVLTTGQQYRFRATAINTGATTCNVDGLGAITLKTVTGVDLPAGYIRMDVDTVCTYDGIYFVAGREMEYGSNANGEFWRYSTGLAISHSVSTTVSGAGWTTGTGGGHKYSGVALYLHAITFSANPKARVQAEDSLLAARGPWLAFHHTTTTGGQLHFASVVEQVSTASFPVTTSAEGRWY